MEYAIALCGALAIQGGPIFWVSGHRQHHAKTEDPVLDPYSAKKGFWWSHWLWIFRPIDNFFDPNRYQKKTPDLTRQWFYRVLDRYYLLLQVPLAFGLYLLGGWSFVIYGIFVRSVILWHTTWLVNSATHRWGYRTFDAKDNARNLWWVALLTYGEGWHNNHHTYPQMAQTGWRWWEVGYDVAHDQRLGQPRISEESECNASVISKISFALRRTAQHPENRKSAIASIPNML